MLNELEEEEYAYALSQEMLYNVSGEKGKTTISPIEFKAFIAWLLSAIGALMYTIWAFVPEDLFKEHFKLHYVFPDRYYMVALSNWWGVGFVTYHITLNCLSMMKSHPRDSYNTMVDQHTRYGNHAEPKVVQKEKDHFGMAILNEDAEEDEQPPPIQELPVNVVCNVLYSKYLNKPVNF